MTDMNTKTTKRWAVLRKTSGKQLRAFASREMAREYKRYIGGNLMLWDTSRNVAVR